MAFDDQETCRGRDTGHYDLCVMETKCTEKLLVSSNFNRRKNLGFEIIEFSYLVISMGRIFKL